MFGQRAVLGELVHPCNLLVELLQFFSGTESTWPLKSGIDVGVDQQVDILRRAYDRGVGDNNVAQLRAGGIGDEALDLARQRLVLRIDAELASRAS